VHRELRSAGGLARSGVTPGRWLLTQRLDRARALLETSDHTVETVARMVGMSSMSNLRRRFISHVSTTPSAYRRTFKSSA
jgi:AraC family transcriptional regulator, transcriptional activator FtrA